MSDDAVDSPETDEKDASEVRGGPTSKAMPPDMSVWREARNLITDKGIRVEELAAACVQDPVIVLELLRVANAMYFSGGRTAITSVKNAIVRLGSEVVLEILEELKARPQITDPEVAACFAVHRNRGRRVAITATILAQVAARQFSDDCQTAALFTSIGEMLAVYHYGEEYVQLAAEHESRIKVNYQLAHNFRFDVEKMGLKYLRKSGLPEAILFPLDRDAKTRNPERAVLRPICLGSAELVEAFDSNKWEKLAPGKTLPSKSNLRLLRVNDDQYLKVYERVAEYLFAVKLAEERANATPEPEPEPEAVDISSNSEHDQLAADIDSLLKGPVPEDIEEEPEEETPPAPQRQATAKKQTSIQSLDYSMVDPEDSFGLAQRPAKSARSKEVKKIEPPQLRTDKGTAMVASITGMFDEVDSSEELLASLLERLTGEGPFEKSALIVVSKDRKSAIVVAARGPSIGNGQRLELNDPLSPLAQCFSKVQSFGNRPNQSSPFGSKAFALAPIQADHDTPVALYADCGTEGSITFEARRIFRIVVDILNQKLPSIPGGIPVEL